MFFSGSFVARLIDVEQKAAEDFLRYCHAKLFAGVGPQAAMFFTMQFCEVFSVY